MPTHASSAPKTIGLLGGSFDPVHEAHVVIAERARDQVPCDEIWLIPAAVAVHKPDGPHAPAEHRLRMLELALAGRRGLSICDLELLAPRPLRSVETVEELRRRHGAHRWRWIMGQDSFDALETWVRPERLLALAAPVVQPRPGVVGERAATRYGVEVFWLEGEPLDLSSTALRQSIARGETDVPGLLPDVRAYVARHHLYADENAEA